MNVICAIIPRIQKIISSSMKELTTRSQSPGKCILVMIVIKYFRQKMIKKDIWRGHTTKPRKKEASWSDHLAMKNDKRMVSVGFGTILNVLMVINVNSCIRRLLTVASKNVAEKSRDVDSTMESTQTRIQSPHPINPLLPCLLLFWGFPQAKPSGKEDSTTNIINI